MSATTQTVSAKFAKNDVRKIKFTGTPRDGRISVRSPGHCTLRMQRVLPNLWVAHPKGNVEGVFASSANKCYRKAVKAFWL